MSHTFDVIERLFSFHFSLAFFNEIIYVAVIYFKFKRHVDIKETLRPIGGEGHSYTEATKQTEPNKY